MELRQKQELRRLLVPELNQSLKILSLSMVELRSLVEEELLKNPLLEEIISKKGLKFENTALPSFRNWPQSSDSDLRIKMIADKVSLQDILIRQLGMFTENNADYQIGYEIIGNIDENGFLRATVQDIALNLGVNASRVEKVLKLIQQFEPTGVGCRTIQECLLIQLEFLNKNDPLLKKIVMGHLEDVAKKNFTHIAKILKEPLDKIMPLIHIILKLDPKPGRNYSTEAIQRIVPDIAIFDKEDAFEIFINDEDLPTLNINEDYKRMLKDASIDPQTKEFLSAKMKNAVELMRAVFRRKATLRKIVEKITEIQSEAIRNDLSCLKPLTFQELASQLGIHESTVCRAVMNKYVRLPYGVVALKEFFTSKIKDGSGQAHSSTRIKRLIKDLIDKEDKKHPLSDQAIVKVLSQEQSLKLARRTVAKYREELKILSTSYRREK